MTSIQRVIILSTLFSVVGKFLPIYYVLVSWSTLNSIMICLYHVSVAQGEYSYVPNYYNRPSYNCSIPRTIQGEWYSREKNLDTVTIIDASRMQRRGVCMQHDTDFGANYTFLFGENPGQQRTCYHCVRIFIRTVNIIEKIESKIFVPIK